MRKSFAAASAPFLIAAPLAAFAQLPSGVQSRDGLGDAGQPTNPANSSPAGSNDAATGPQSRPAYPSGSTTPNPGAAFVRTQPKPATGALKSPPGAITTKISKNGAASRSNGLPVGEAATPPK